jgi:hypothetical protein
LRISSLPALGSGRSKALKRIARIPTSYIGFASVSCETTGDLHDLRGGEIWCVGVILTAIPTMVKSGAHRFGIGFGLTCCYHMLATKRELNVCPKQIGEARSGSRMTGGFSYDLIAEGMEAKLERKSWCRIVAGFQRAPRDHVPRR